MSVLHYAVQKRIDKEDKVMSMPWSLFEHLLRYSHALVIEIRLEPLISTCKYTKTVL